MSRILLCLVLIVAWCKVLPNAVAQDGDSSTAQATAGIQTATATVPRLIKVSGKILDKTGYALRGPIDITFSFYEDSKSGRILWHETQHVQLDDSGRYSVLLGSQSEQGVPLNIFTSGEARWLGIRPDGMSERPRVLLLSVPFALKAGDAETLGGKPASAYALANQAATPGAVPAGGSQLKSAAASSTVHSLDATPCLTITSDGNGSANQIAKFTSSCNVENSAIYESNGLVGIGNTSPAGTLDVSGNTFIRGLLQLTPLGVASGGGGFNSNAIDLQASSFNGNSSLPAVQDFQWIAEPTGSGSGSPSATLNLRFGSNGATPSETGLSVQSNGIINFAPGQTFPSQGSGTVTNISTGAGLTGGPITNSGTIAVANGGITNAMISTPSITVQTGSGLSGGGTVSLGGTITLTNTAQGTGTVTNIATGSGLTGGPITNSGTIGIAPGGVTNTMLATPSINVQTGAGLSGGGSVPLGGTLTLTNTALGTVTAINTTSGLVGGPITNNGTIGIAPGGVTNAMLANPSITVNAGSGLSGGGTVGLGGTITLTNTAQNSGTITTIATGAGLTGGPITKTGTISIPAAGITNTMLANPSITVNAGSGLSGGGTVGLGGTITLTNTAQNSGTITTIATGAGLTGGPITKTGTISIPAAGITNTMLANPSITVNAGSGLSGGGTVGLGGTITLTNTAQSSGTITTIATGAGLTGGPITKTGTISIPAAGISNTMLANNAITVKAGTGLSGGGTVALGGTVTLTNTSPSAGGTVTSITTGPGLAGGTITGKGTISIPTAGVTTAMLATPTITVKAGTGLSGGGTVALGGTVTLTNTSPSSGGTVKSIVAGTGLKGGTITGTGTMSLDTAFTDARYMPIGGALSGVLTVQGLVSQPTGAATTKQGFPGGPLDTEASVFNTTLARGVNYLYRWEAEPTGNNSANTNATLNLLYGVPGSVLETGLSINRSGIIKFASGQTFPGGSGTGTITGVTAGTGLVGGGTSGAVTLSLPKICAKGQVLVWSGTAWACGANGAITGVTAGPGLVGGGTTGAITLSLPKTCAKGQVMSWNGTAWACSTVGSAALGTSGGLAYFSGSSLVSTAAPTNGQILIGSTGKLPVLTTLKAGSNVSITDGPGSITISATGGGGSPTLQFFTTGGGNTGSASSAGINVDSLWGILLPYNVTTTEVIYDVTKADKTANKYDVGIYNSAGTLIVNLGSIAGTTFAPATGFKTLKWKQASATLSAGRYYLGFTTNCKTNCAQIGAGVSFVSFVVGASGGATANGVLASSIHPPADTWGSGNQPMVVIR